MSADLAPGDLIVFASKGCATGVFADHLVARVEAVRDRDLTAFPWRGGDRRWEKRRFRIDLNKVVQRLPDDADVEAVFDRLNVLRNERDLRKARLERDYRAKIVTVARSGAKAGA